ncbi:MAG TPA: hypothetical protein PK295_00440 [Candidatus Magasanikbacteria bacterium]|nr:hypothetical protein [Candidatus Magasanikbacteria bacterium]
MIYVFGQMQQEESMAKINGLVTVRTKGTVTMKIIAGSDGHKAGLLEAYVRKHWPLTKFEAYDAATKIGFGSKDDLIVMTTDNLYHECGTAPSGIHFRTFEQTEFNPRSQSGVPEYVEVIDL